MTTVVLRVQGEHLDVDQCLTWLPETELEAIWRVGDKRIGGRISTTSGFNILLSEGEDTSLAIEEAMSAFLSLAPRVAALVQSGATATIDFALFVEETGARSIKLAPSVVRSIGQYDVSIAVSAYPCADQ